MSFVKFFALFLIICIASVLALPRKHEKDDDENLPLDLSEKITRAEWESWKQLYNKNYDSVHEEAVRYHNWLKNYRFVARHNLKASMNKTSFTTGMNKFSDMSLREITNTMNGFRMDPEHDQSKGDVCYKEQLNLTATPQHLDWRDHGIVTPVKDQGRCGSCWSFSATGAVEGLHAKVTGELVSLSEQNLLDCDKKNNGCSGGTMDMAYEYIIKNGGIDTEECYPYQGSVQKSCKFDADCIGATIASYGKVCPYESAVRNVIAVIGPLSTAVDASQYTFQFYEGGIYDEPRCGNQRYSLTHAMLIVGYGTENGKDYWIVKNSYGSSWGENGYIRMSRNKNNQCGILTYVNFVWNKPLPQDKTGEN